jgi:hypothetical protein
MTKKKYITDWKVNDHTTLVENLCRKPKVWIDFEILAVTSTLCAQTGLQVLCRNAHTPTKVM